MSSNLKNQMHQLHFISKLKNKKLRTDILKEKSGEDNLFKSLKEIIINLMKKNFPISQKNKKSLKKYKNIFRLYLNSKINKRKRKQLVSQSGGFLPTLIPIVASAIASILIK